MGLTNLTRSILLLMLILIAGPIHAERWSTLQGQVFDAQFRGMWGSRAVFERSDGKKAVIPFSSMAADSRFRIQKANPDIQKRRNKRIAQLRQSAEYEAAETMGLGPMGQLLVSQPPKLAPQTEYAPLPEQATLEETVRHIYEQSHSGHLRVYWDMLPKKHQEDLDALRLSLMAQYPAEQWDDRIDLIQQLNSVLQKKQDMIVGFPLLAHVPSSTKDAIRQRIAAVASLMAPALNSGLLKHDSLSSKSMEQLSLEISQGLSGPYRSALMLVPASKFSDIEDAEFRDGGLNKGSVVWLGKPSENWVRVDGRWIPEELAVNWDQQLSQSQLLMSSAMPADDRIFEFAKSLISSVAGASDQAAFNNAIGRALMAAEPVILAMGGRPIDLRAKLPPEQALAGGPGVPGGRPPGGPGHRPPGGPNSGLADSSMSEMEAEYMEQYNSNSASMDGSSTPTYDSSMAGSADMAAAYPGADMSGSDATMSGGASYEEQMGSSMSGSGSPSTGSPSTGSPGTGSPGTGSPGTGSPSTGTDSSGGSPI